MVLTFIRPCRPVLTKTVPPGEAWLHEPKLDGYRLQVVKEGRQVRLFSRQGHDWTPRVPGLMNELAEIACWSAIIDAELCLPGDAGVPNFIGLHLQMRRHRHELVVFGFDLLHRDGADLRPRPLLERRRRLERLLARSTVRCLRLVACFDDGEQLLEAADRYGLEGIVSKRRAAPYRSGPSRDWRKIKTAVWREANRERWRLFDNG